jgi:GAF domain-containing protein
MTTRTPDVVAEVHRLRRVGAPLDEILRRSVEMLHQANPRFHWTGIYELYPDNMLHLGPFVGAPTDHVFIGVGQGVCGTAVALKRNINLPDVAAEPNYLACSQETKSELVVLIRSGDTIHAQIDIDSHEYGAFDEASEALVQAVADALAEAYADRRPTRIAQAS